MSLVLLQGAVKDSTGGFWHVELDTSSGSLKLVPIQSGSVGSQNMGSNSPQTGNTNVVQSQATGVGRKPGDSPGPGDGLIPPEPGLLNPAFKQRLSSVLTDNKYDRRLPKRRRGKLAMQGLWRVEAGAANVFSQKQARRGKHYNVVLVVDDSGSMSDWGNPGGEIKAAIRADRYKYPTTDVQELAGRYRIRRIDKAVDCAIFLATHFQELDIDFSVISYGSRSALVKPLGQAITPEKLRASFKARSGSTIMLPALKLALEQLKRADGRSLVIVIGDGDTDEPDKIKRLIQANPQLEFFGVGIAGADMAVIPEHAAVADLDKLQPEILRWLGRKIKRGV